MTPRVLDRPTVVDCLDCGQPTSVARDGVVPRYCPDCKRRHREFAARDAEARQRGARTTEAELALCVSEQRLHIEAGKACLRLAILRDDWRLVDIALDELEGIDRVADFRKVCGL